MIFYYSATGNSYWVAKQLSDAMDERLVSVTDALKSKDWDYALGPDETLGFVFPVHAWNPPKTFLNFLSRMKLNSFDGQYVFAIATCGDSAGATMRAFGKALAKKGLPLDAKWELAMPNNYLPMYDIDSPELERTKLEQAEIEMARIKGIVTEHEPDTRLIGGRGGVFMTTVSGFLFRRFAIRSAPFYANDACISCGRCARICLTGAIHMGDGKPEWHDGCDHCCACINRCPVHAIQYGKATESRGRYCHPIWRSGLGR